MCPFPEKAKFDKWNEDGLYRFKMWVFLLQAKRYYVISLFVWILLPCLQNGNSFLTFIVEEYH
jgi:hypothetical protein